MRTTAASLILLLAACQAESAPEVTEVEWDGLQVILIDYPPGTVSNLDLAAGRLFRRGPCLRFTAEGTEYSAVITRGGVQAALAAAGGGLGGGHLVGGGGRIFGPVLRAVEQRAPTCPGPYYAIGSIERTPPPWAAPNPPDAPPDPALVEPSKKGEGLEPPA